MNKTAIIIGAGPAGLTTALELLEKTNITPIIVEASEYIGGISRTHNYKGNHIDIGGHRFFSKSDTVMNWWLKILPQQTDTFLPKDNEKIMMVRNRLSRIYFLRKFFNYPISLNIETLKNLGFIRLIKIGFTYALIKLFPLKDEKTLEQFFINRFGKELYATFFRDYTEKVWGVPCSQINSEWGAQRIKGLSVSTAIIDALKKIFGKKSSINQKDIETSLIEQYYYPKYGPGQLWTEVADKIIKKGGKILFNKKAVSILNTETNITEITIKNIKTKEQEIINGDYFISTMPVKDLIASFSSDVPKNVQTVASGLVYRDFITVGLLLENLTITNKTNIKTHNNIVPDNWIYIQENDVKLGRLQVFNNWSPYMVKDKNKAWIGLEYFCNEGDELWEMQEEKFIKFAIQELEKIDIINSKDVIDSVMLKVPKTYPAYFGTYNRFDEIRNYTDKIENLFLIGRNGMHRYNNMDHSMLTAITAVKNIKNNILTKNNIWEVNTEEEYHESK